MIAMPKIKGKDTLKNEEEVFIDYRFTITYMGKKDINY